VTPLDSVYDRALPHGVSNAKQGVAEEQNNLEDEETVWQLPEQLSIPFLRQLELPLESKKECSPTWDDGLSTGEASQDAKSMLLRNDGIEARGPARGASQESCGSGPLRRKSMSTSRKTHPHTQGPVRPAEERYSRLPVRPRCWSG
jgi:hypothetical protein